MDILRRILFVATILATTAVLALVTTSGVSAATCYNLTNKTQIPLHFQVHYPVPVGPPQVTAIDVDPGKTIPNLCFAGVAGTIYVQANFLVRDSAGTEIRGIPGNLGYGFVFGEGDSNALKAGSFSIESRPRVFFDPNAATPTPPPLYIVLSSQVVKVVGPCGIFNPCGNFSCMGACNVLHVKIKCGPTAPNRDQVFALSCNENGTLCNLNDHELFHGLTQFSIGDHCTHIVPGNSSARRR